MIYKQEKFMLYLQIKGLSASTRGGVERVVKRFEQWQEKENLSHEQVSYNDILAYVNKLKEQGNKAVTIQKIVQNLKLYYAFLVEQEDVFDNPCSNVSIKGIQRKHLYKTYSRDELDEIYSTFCKLPPKKHQYADLFHAQHKVMLGLIIYQGLRVDEIKRLRLSSLQLREGKITIEAVLRTAGRTLKLESQQLYELMDYLHQTRKEILSERSKYVEITENDLLFETPQGGANIDSSIYGMRMKLLSKYPKLGDLKQLRGSVISNWLKEYDLRKVQYLAGHKFVSSTEAYKANNLEDLKEEVNRYHPDF